MRLEAFAHELVALFALESLRLVGAMGKLVLLGVGRLLFGRERRCDEEERGDGDGVERAFHGPLWGKVANCDAMRPQTGATSERKSPMETRGYRRVGDAILRFLRSQIPTS